MTNQVIPAEAVEAAAKAVWERDHPAIQWDVIGQARQYELRLTARAALEAAAPHMPKCSGRHWVDAPEDDSGW